MPILQGHLRGKRWIAGSSQHGCWLGSYEFQKQNTFCLYVRQGDVVWDLGADAGFYSLLASVLVGSAGRVFSFEPLPTNQAYLRKHILISGILNCKAFDLAVGDRDGTCSFEIVHTHQCHLIGQELADKNANVITVRTVRLDDLVSSSEILPPNLIKCGIEGTEFEALSGAAETISRYRPTIFLATHGRQVHDRCCDFLSRLNYELLPIDESSVEKAEELLALPTGIGAL